jgi:opacity protein-like surface antigen
MKFKWGLCGAVVLLAAVSFAQENTKPYIRVSGGGAVLNDADLSESGFTTVEAEFDAGYVLGAAGGVELGVLPVRVEAEFGYQKNDIDKLKAFGTSVSVDGDVSIMTLMLNGYYDFKNKSFITPYLMAGVGAARIDAELEGDSEDDTVLAVQVGAGLAFEVTENVSIDTEYRYFLTDDPDFGDIEAEISGHRLQVGVRYTFN